MDCVALLACYLCAGSNDSSGWLTNDSPLLLLPLQVMVIVIKMSWGGARFTARFKMKLWRNNTFFYLKDYPLPHKIGNMYTHHQSPSSELCHWWGFSNSGTQIVEYSGSLGWLNWNLLNIVFITLLFPEDNVSQTYCGHSTLQSWWPVTAAPLFNFLSLCHLEFMRSCMIHDGGTQGNS